MDITSAFTCPSDGDSSTLVRIKHLPNGTSSIDKTSSDSWSVAPGVATVATTLTLPPTTSIHFDGQPHFSSTRFGKSANINICVTYIDVGVNSYEVAIDANIIGR